MKDLLAGEQQAAVTVAVEGLMDAKPPPELEAFATFDPRVRLLAPPLSKPRVFSGGHEDGKNGQLHAALLCAPASSCLVTFMQ